MVRCVFFGLTDFILVYRANCPCCVASWVFRVLSFVVNTRIGLHFSLGKELHLAL